MSLLYFGNVFVKIFVQISLFLKYSYLTIILKSFVPADVGNQLKAGLNAMEEDNASMQHITAAHCGRKMLT